MLKTFLLFCCSYCLLGFGFKCICVRLRLSGLLESEKYMNLHGLVDKMAKTFYSCAAVSLTARENTCIHSCNISPYCPLNQVHVLHRDLEYYLGLTCVVASPRIYREKQKCKLPCSRQYNLVIFQLPGNTVDGF